MPPHTKGVVMDIEKKQVMVKAGAVTLEGFLAVPEAATGIVVFVHGSGSSRHSPRNQAVAEEFNEHGLATLLFDLLTAEEERVDVQTRHLRFDIGMLTERVVGAVDWLASEPLAAKMQVGLIGSSTGAAAALMAAGKLGRKIAAVVSRGGRPDLAAPLLGAVQAPTLLIVGARDEVVIELNEEAFNQLNCKKRMELVPHATHLFEEPGTLEQASHLARRWFLDHLG